MSFATTESENRPLGNSGRVKNQRPWYYIFVADDFTGASDTLATLARVGKRARLFLDVPSLDDVADLDAFGVATDARALGNVEVKMLMDRIGTLLAAHRPKFLHYKVCSTFDSAPDIGNFVTATDQLCQTFGISSRAIIGGQPSLGRYCIFGNLFARATDGKTYRIDRHPVMRAHPVTPMIESDLRVHLSNLGGGDIHLSDRLMPDMAANAVTLFDALERPSGKPPFNGPALAFVGSRSSVSHDQVERARAYTRISVEPTAFKTGKVMQRAISLLEQKKNVLIHIKDRSAKPQHARDTAMASAKLIGEIILQVQVGVLVIAGGDTSSAIIKELTPQCLSCIGDIDPGVPLCLAHFTSGQKLPVVLKGGQVGRSDLLIIYRKG